MLFQQGAEHTPPHKQLAHAPMLSCPANPKVYTSRPAPIYRTVSAELHAYDNLIIRSLLNVSTDTKRTIFFIIHPLE